MTTEPTPKPEDNYLLERWNQLSARVDRQGKAFVVRLNRDVHKVTLGLNDNDGDMSIVNMTPDQARAIATMLVYAAQEAEQ